MIYHACTKNLGWKTFDNKCVEFRFLDAWKFFEFLDKEDHRLALIPHNEILIIEAVDETKTVRLNPHF